MTRLTLTAVLAATLGLAACAPTTHEPGSLIPTGPFVLVGIGSDTVPQRNVGLTINADGSLSGQAPCSHYTATQAAEPPAFAISDLMQTPSGGECTSGGSRLESRYFETLRAADGIKWEGGVLTIMGPTWLTFEPGYRKE